MKAFKRRTSKKFNYELLKALYFNQWRVWVFESAAREISVIDQFLTIEEVFDYNNAFNKSAAGLLPITLPLDLHKTKSFVLEVLDMYVKVYANTRTNQIMDKYFLSVAEVNAILAKGEKPYANRDKVLSKLSLLVEALTNKLLKVR